MNFDSEPSDSIEQPTPPQRRRLVAAVAATLVAMLAAVGIVIRVRFSGTPVAAPSPSASFSDSLIPGDASRFVGDITFPDGAKVKVKVNQRFDKGLGAGERGKGGLAQAFPGADEPHR